MQLHVRAQVFFTQAVDIDGDGWLDLLKGANDALYVARGAGEPRSVPVPATLPTSNFIADAPVTSVPYSFCASPSANDVAGDKFVRSSVTTGDVNGDGRVDLITFQPTGVHANDLLRLWMFGLMRMSGCVSPNYQDHPYTPTGGVTVRWHSQQASSSGGAPLFALGGDISSTVQLLYEDLPVQAQLVGHHGSGRTSVNGVVRAG